MRKITNIEQLKEDVVHIELDNNEYATLYKWGERDCYVTTSENLHKSTLRQFKLDCIGLNFNAKELEKIYL